jgi:peptide/nickel transport system permease protein
MVDTSETPATEQMEPRPPSGLTQFFRRLVRDQKMGAVGGVIVLLMLFAAIFAELLAPFPYQETHIKDRLEAPGAEYFLGTDGMGRDVFSRILYGARISLYVGLGASAINVIVAAIVGVPSGFIGGRFDLVVQRFVDAMLSFPGLILLITVMSLVGVGLVQVIVVMGVLGGIGWIRVMRGAAIGIRENVYFDAARATGGTILHMLRQHVLPNIMPVMIIAFSVSVAGNILAEASLSFLGVGIPPPFPSWGSMLSWEGRQYMYQATWLAIWPGVALSVAVYGVSMLGDAIRDMIDPRLRGGVGSYGRARKLTGRKKGRLSKKEG